MSKVWAPARRVSQQLWAWKGPFDGKSDILLFEVFLMCGCMSIPYLCFCESMAGLPLGSGILHFHDPSWELWPPTQQRSILNQEYCFLTYLSHILVSPFYLTLILGMKGGTRVKLSFHRCPWCPRGGCPMSGTNKRLEWFLPLLLQMTHTCIVHWLLKVLESNICYIHGHKSLCLA